MMKKRDVTIWATIFFLSLLMSAGLVSAENEPSLSIKQTGLHEFNLKGTSINPWTSTLSSK